MKSQRFAARPDWMRRLLLAAATAVVACQSHTHPPIEPGNAPASNPADCRTIEHKVGATEICGQPQRIVVLGPYVLEPLLALEVQPVGYADHIAFHQGDYTEPNQQIPYLGDLITQPITNVGLAGTPSIEAILKLKPDLIIGIGGDDERHKTLSQIAPTLLFDYLEPDQNLRTIAAAVNRSEKAERLLNQNTQQLEAAKDAFTSLVEAASKVALISASNLQTISLMTTFEDNQCASIIGKLGFKLTFPPGLNQNEASDSVPISIESLPQLNNADLIIFFGHNLTDLKQFEGMENFEDHQLSSIKQAWKENAIAQSLDASKAGRVYFIPTYLCRGLPGAIGTELYLKELQEQLLAPS